MFVYWILFPLLLGATLAGLGLGIRRYTVPFAPALILPLGYGTAVMISAVVTWYGSLTELTAPVLLILAGAGWAVNWRILKAGWESGAVQRQWPWIVAGIFGFLCFGASAIATGHPTFTGYNQIVDLAPQMEFSAYLGVHGRDAITGISSALNTVNSTLSTGYPAGPQSVLGTFPTFFGMLIQWSYQPYIAIAAALTVVASYGLLQQVTPNRAFAAIGAFCAGQASCLIGYGQIGGIKELTVVPLVLTSGALIATAVNTETKWWRATLPFAIALAGTYSVFSLTMLPWLAILGLGAAIMIWRNSSLREAALRAGFAIVFFAVITIPTSIPASHSGSFANLMKKEQGNLANPVSHWAFSPVWITRDHRFTLGGDNKLISVIIACVIVAFALVGLYFAWKRKAQPLIILLSASLVGMILLIFKFGPWVEFKGMVIEEPAMAVLALAGLAFFLHSGKKPLVYGAWFMLAAFFFVQMYTNVLRYGAAQMAPYHRLSELQNISTKYAGTKGTLEPDWDENGGFLLRQVAGAQGFNYPFIPTAAWNAKGLPFDQQYEWDLDDFEPYFANSFEMVVLRRSPGQSRPGRQFKHVAQTRYFDIWRRGLAAATASHQPYSGVANTDEQTKCQEYVSTRDPASTVTIAPATPFSNTAVFDPKGLSKGVSLLQGNTAALSAGGSAGTAKGTIDVGANTGSFDVFVTDLSRRSVSVSVAGQSFNVERDPSAAPRGQYVGHVELAAGTQPVVLKVGSTSLYPGSSKAANSFGWVGYVTVVPTGTMYPPLIIGKPSEVHCPLATDWVETSYGADG